MAHDCHIRIKGRLDPRWSRTFDGMSVTYIEETTETTLHGPIADQAALHGLLARIRDLNLELVALELSAPAQA